MIFHAEQRKVRTEWGGQEMTFQRYRLLFPVSYFRDDESIIYKSSGVGENGRPLQKNVSLFSMCLHYLET